MSSHSDCHSTGLEIQYASSQSDSLYSPKAAPSGWLSSKENVIVIRNFSILYVIIIVTLLRKKTQLETFSSNVTMLAEVSKLYRVWKNHLVRSPYIAQAGLKLAILLPQPPYCLWLQACAIASNLDYQGKSWESAFSKLPWVILMMVWRRGFWKTLICRNAIRKVLLVLDKIMMILEYSSLKTIGFCKNSLHCHPRGLSMLLI